MLYNTVLTLLFSKTLRVYIIETFHFLLELKQPIGFLTCVLLRKIIYHLFGLRRRSFCTFRGFFKEGHNNTPPPLHTPL